MDRVKFIHNFVFFLWMVTIFFNTGLCTPSFVKSEDIQNKFCASAAIVDLGETRSLLECSGRCFSETWCQSFFYKPVGICVGCELILNNSTGCLEEGGTKYYIATTAMSSSTPPSATTESSVTTAEPPVTTITELPTTTPTPTLPTAITFPMIDYGMPCLDDTDCHGANTACMNFFCWCDAGYFPGFLTCTDGCAIYAPSFTQHFNRALNDPDGIYYEGTSFIQCMNICLDSNCPGFNYNPFQTRCMITFETPVTSPTDYMYHTQVDYYSRNCDIIN